MCFVKAFAMWACIFLCSFGRSGSGIVNDFSFKYKATLPTNCRPFSNTSADLAQLCGYNSTAQYRYPAHFSMAAIATRYVLKLVGNCSPYAREIVCSYYLPRCEPYIRGPFLPCRRVCDEFQQKCAAEITRHGLEWIIAICQLLPRKDDPQTTLGYLGRCFEPQNFRTNITVASEPQNLTCHPLVVPICQNLGYTQTILSPTKQRAYEQNAKRELEKHFPGDNNTDCKSRRKTFYCTENFPACINNQLAFYCRDRCFEFFEKNCSSVFSFEEDMCIEFPEGMSKVDICKQIHWPKAENWPNIRMTVPPPAKGGVSNKTPTPTGVILVSSLIIGLINLQQ